MEVAVPEGEFLDLEAFTSRYGEEGVERTSKKVSTCTFTKEGAFDFIDGVEVLILDILL